MLDIHIPKRRNTCALTQKEENSDQKQEKKKGIQKPQDKEMNEDKRIQ